MRFPVNFKHMDTYLLRFLFGRVESKPLKEVFSGMHPPRKQKDQFWLKGLTSVLPS